MRETHTRRVPFVPADEPDQSFRAKTRRRLAALSWSRRHPLRWLVPPLVASAVINGVLLVSALTQPELAATSAPSTRRAALSNVASAKIGPTTSTLEQGADFPGSTAALPTTTTESRELALVTQAAAAPSTAVPPTPPPSTGVPSTSPAEPEPAGPTTAAPTTLPQPQPVALPITSTTPTTDPPAPTSDAPIRATESDDEDDEDDRDDDDDREDRREDRREERERARAEREDRGNGRD